MALKIRLRHQGRVNRPFYRVVVTDSSVRRDGKYIESIGWYNPLEEAEKSLEIKPDRLQHWLSVGAQMSEKVEALVAKSAPGMLKEYKEKLAQRDAKLTAKRRELRRKKVAVAS